MPQQPGVEEDRISQMRAGLSIRTLVVAIATLPAILLATLLIWLLAGTADKISERLEEAMLRASTQRVSTDVHAFLADAVRLSDLYARRLESNVLPRSQLNVWERYLLDDLAVSPGIAAISFGNAQGECTAAIRRAGHLEIDRISADGAAAKFILDDQALQIPSQPTHSYRFDVRSRPWYKAALSLQSPSWIPIYVWETDSAAQPRTQAEGEIGTGYVRPIHGPDGKLNGALLVDVTLGGMSEFLGSLPIAKDGSVFIIDEQGLIVAASAGSVLSRTGERLNFSLEHTSLATILHPPQKSKSATDLERSLELTIDSKPVRVRTALIQPYPGVQWTILAAIPEQVLLGDAQILKQQAFWACLAAIAASLIFAILYSRRLSQPISQLADHVHRVGSGDFNAHLNIRAAREFVSLSKALNQMTSDLKHRMELEQSLAVAKEVQQSLLPREAPRTSGLDIAGKSRYCDATGGDYYDFIEIPPDSEQLNGRVLIAVGDVSGHGVASALLMATARGALRASSNGSSAPLSDLMADVNQVLSKNASGGGFMTLILLLLDPANRTLQWCSAGHGPPLVYNPSSREFSQLCAGNVPLGIDETATYETHTICDVPSGLLIFLGTDGIWETLNAGGEMFGEDRLKDILRQSAGRPSADILTKIDQEVARFCGDNPSRDDITAVAIRFK